MTQQRGIKDGFLRTYAPAIALAQRVTDATFIVLALYVMLRIYDEPWRVEYTAATCVAVLAFHLLSELNGLYRGWRGAPVISEIRQIVLTWVCVIPILLFLGFATKQTEEFSRVVSVGWFLLAPNLIALWRVAVRFLLQEIRRRGRNSRTVAIVGMTRAAERLCEHMSDPAAGMRVVGFYDDRIASRRYHMSQQYAEFRGGFEDLLRHVNEEHIDYVYIALPLRAESRISDLLQRLSDTTASVFVVGDFFVFDLLQAQWSSIGDVPVVSIHDTPFHGLGGWVKRLEDIVLSTLILLLISLPMLAIATAIKLTSRGPIFFVQRRYGLNGREIPVIKFRSMTVCEDGPVVRQASKFDARVTPLGAFLRRTSLDELPQFFNVLAGHMSIVGPRPHAIAHNELYRSQIYRYMLRHKVKPGITGWAQVNGWRGETETLDKMEKRLEHDLYYIQNWNLGLDMRIILLTVFSRKVRSNAY
jgi:putative colanic acid biosynthesis UDP-glucose lipid carrier transferase